MPCFLCSPFCHDPTVLWLAVYPHTICCRIQSPCTSHTHITSRTILKHRLQVPNLPQFNITNEDDAHSLLQMHLVLINKLQTSIDTGKCIPKLLCYWFYQWRGNAIDTPQPHFHMHSKRHSDLTPNPMPTSLNHNMGTPRFTMTS